MLCIFFVVDGLAEALVLLQAMNPLTMCGVDVCIYLMYIDLSTHEVAIRSDCAVILAQAI